MAEQILPKRCNKCKLTKPLSQFGKRSNRPIGHQSICKACQKCYRQSQNGQYYKRHLKALAQERFGNLCSICRRRITWIDRDFAIHHIYNDNKYKGQAILQPKTWGVCIVLCPNCHRNLHYLSFYSDESLNKLLKYRNILIKKAAQNGHKKSPTRGRLVLT